MQAQEDARWARRQKELLDNERELMAGRDIGSGWVVNKPRYWTQAETKPDQDALDHRRIGAW